MATSVNMTGIVNTDDAYIWERASINSNKIGTASIGRKFNITQLDNNFCYASEINGWLETTNIDLSNNENSNSINIHNKEDQATKIEQYMRDKLQGAYDTLVSYVDENLSSSLTDQEISDSLLVNDLNGIYGIPYQFMESVDPRLPKSTSLNYGGDYKVGRKYSEKILSKMPLLCITPGKVDFMSNFSKDEKTGVLAKLITGDNDVDVADIINKNGHYFTFNFAYKEYFNYVNSLCSAGARFLNIKDVELNINGQKDTASRFSWEKALNSNLKATLTSQEFIGFYIDSSATDSVSETFSNNTTQSQIASTVNGISDQAKELRFLLGSSEVGKLYELSSDTIRETMDAITDMTSKYTSGSFISNIGNNFQTIATGGKLLFPEIWSDSEFSKDFSITIKLRTPDADVMSWFINIYVPLCHLIALAAGHQTETVNGYYSPFLVRAFYKGLFNVDMGIVTNMSIRKGKEAAWNIDGLPTEIDVDLNIKDLYGMLSIVSDAEPKNFVTNNILMDYVANTCGININQMDIQRSLEIYYILFTNRVVNLPNRISRHFQDAIDNFGQNLYNKALNKFLI